MTLVPARLSSRSMAFILAGGRGSRLRELTDNRAKPAVYFGGKTRIIDFALSNALNSGIRKMAIATQYKAHPLIRHRQRGWNFFRAERNEYLDILLASQRVDDSHWHEGTADAVFQNIDIADSHDIDYGGIFKANDHLYKMDYEVMIREHVENGADVTVGCLTVPRADAHAFGVMAVDHSGRITEFAEKPKNPAHLPGDPLHSLASMGIYVFRWKFLRQLLRDDANDKGSTHDFGGDIIPTVVKNGKAMAHRFEDLASVTARAESLCLARCRHGRCLLEGQYRPHRVRTRTRPVGPQLADLDLFGKRAAGQVHPQRGQPPRAGRVVAGLGRLHHFRDRGQELADLYRCAFEFLGFARSCRRAALCDDQPTRAADQGGDRPRRDDPRGAGGRRGSPRRMPSGSASPGRG